MTDLDPQTAAPADARVPPPLKLFRVFMRMGVWRVTRNDAHYGDYSARLIAVEAAETAVAEVLRRGGLAELSMAAPPAHSR
jgi:hypothetical protein